MLPREEDDLLDLEPGEAAEELLARHARGRAATAAPPSTWTRAWRARTASASARAPLPAEPAPRDARRGRRRLRPGRLGEAIGGLLRVRRRRSTSATSRSRAVTVAERLAHLRALLRRGALHVRRGRPRRRPRDRRGDAVRAARALQAGRGDVDAGRAVRRHRDRARQSPRPAHGAVAMAQLTELARIVEALLFLCPEPVSVEDARRGRRVRDRRARARARPSCARATRRARGIELRELAGGWRWPPPPTPSPPRGGCWPSRARRR